MLQPLPLADAACERRDAARNRRALLTAAERLVEQQGACAVTMDAVAAAAGVGKGTVYRRFGSRGGLMTALLDHTEAEWQAAVISGPPPLGPGAEPWERLVAFGRSRLRRVLTHLDLIQAAGARSSAAHSFTVMHVRHLLGELGVEGDQGMLAVSLLAPLQAPVLQHVVRVEGTEVQRVEDAWVDLAHRVVGPADSRGVRTPGATGRT